MSDLKYTKIKLNLEQFDSLCTQMDAKIDRLNKDNFIQVKDVEDLNKQVEDIGEAIHYPDCWDTVAYPSLLDAIKEIANCNYCDGNT